MVFHSYEVQNPIRLINGFGNQDNGYLQWQGRRPSMTGREHEESSGEAGNVVS